MVEGRWGHLFVFLEYLAEVACLAVAQEEGDIGDIHLTGYHVLFGDQELTKMDVIHHTDMIIFLKDPAEIATAHSCLLRQV